MAGPDAGAAGGNAWGDYWRLTPEGAAHAAGGAQHEALGRFWREALSPTLGAAPGARLLDFACGNGALSALVLDLARESGLPMPDLHGADGAATAVAAYRSRIPGAMAVVADARRLPFADGAFAVVASQFGLEYAGVIAVAEAARLVGPGGRLAAVLHLRDGAIHRECAANLAAMERLRESQVLPAAKEVFRRAASVARGQGSRGGFRRADERLAGAVKELEALLRDAGPLVAGGAVRRLYDDLAHLYGRLGAHDPDEVSRWADAMASEVEAYSARMAAMLAAAFGDDDIREAASLATSHGLVVRRFEALTMGAGEPAAWALVCDRA